MNYRLIHGEAIETMKKLIYEGVRVDAIITDPPYGTTACKWDTVIDFAKMWDCLKQIRKEKAPVVLFGSEPFSSALRMSNIKEYKYDWIWNKKKGGNIMNLKFQPYKIHEIISLFYIHNYFPIMTEQKVRQSKTYSEGIANGVSNYGDMRIYKEKYPISICEFSNASQIGKVHPTQKPVELIEYLIKTYTKENDTVLDFTCGSGSTGIACAKLNRNFIGIDNGYCEKQGSEFFGKRWIDVAHYRIEQVLHAN